MLNKNKSITFSLHDFFDAFISGGLITVGGTTTGAEFGDA
jgi:hypothetical protein